MMDKNLHFNHAWIKITAIPVFHDLIVVFFNVWFQGCSQWLQKGSTVLIQRKTAILVLMQSKPAISMAAAKGNVPPSSPSASKRTPTKVKRAARSVVIKHSGRSWIVCHLSLATGFFSVLAKLRAVQSGEGKQ